MDELKKFESIEALKASSKPIDPTSTRSKESHDRFEGFINFLKGGNVTYASPSPNNVPVSRDTFHGL